MIELTSEKPQKTRTGLYIDETLFRQVQLIAERNGLSVNETFILLIKKGIYRETTK